MVKKNVKIKMFTPRKVEITDDGKIITWVNSRKIITREVKPQTLGQLQLKFEFRKKGRNPITVFGYSHIHDLSDTVELNQAKREAFKSAYKDVPFSPDSFSITGENFFYFETRTDTNKWVDSRKEELIA